MHVDIAAMPGKDEKLLEKKRAMQNILSIIVPLAGKKKKERSATGEDAPVAE